MKTLLAMLALISTVAVAEDTRQLAPLPPAAQESLRQEMLDNLVAVNEVLSLMAEGKVKEAGEAAETKLGVSAKGKRVANRAVRRVSDITGTPRKEPVNPLLGLPGFTNDAKEEKEENEE